MTVDTALLAARIARIRTELKHLDRLESLDLQAFLASPVEQAATERQLQVVIEACLDIGHHIISRVGLRRPADYREVFSILREEGIVDADLGRRLEDMAGFRNRLVHGYLQIDSSQVYSIARSDLADIEAFVAAVSRRFGGS